MTCSSTCSIAPSATVRRTGEPFALIGELGSATFGRDRGTRDAVDLIVHGHAHAGTEKRATPRGIPVRNVAQPVLRRPYAIYGIETAAARDPDAPDVQPAAANAG
jgi:hypothetical protein